ncbi:hypothetical protein CQ018_13230 [Arthrobacter sp. MYb227]|uniref:hypothetical protein n=1 Tax=Arthrobacter sp. MYb227 TaxID=1848601 RepID=UPI000D40C218|nr:hypothetical protein [Arthrobacter sp. MYb227]PQZ91597.1 hypothetical protein CQ018_13230 [Arthrobacter sp. MYb227]
MFWKRRDPVNTASDSLTAMHEIHVLLTEHRAHTAAELFVAAFSSGAPEVVRIEELAVLLLRHVGAEPRTTHKGFSLCLEPNGTAARAALDMLWLWERAGIAKVYPGQDNFVFPLLRGNRALSSDRMISTLTDLLSTHDLPVPEILTTH